MLTLRNFGSDRDHEYIARESISDVCIYTFGNRIQAKHSMRLWVPSQRPGLVFHDYQNFTRDQ
jgi:hypothetical protein